MRAAVIWQQLSRHKSKSHFFAGIEVASDDAVARFRGNNMLRWALIFFVVAIVAAIFGFGGIAGDAAWIGKILLVVFLILAIVSLFFGRRGPVT